MMSIPNHLNRSPNEIISEEGKVFYEFSGFMYRAMSWLDVADRCGDFPAFYYACIDARLAIEHQMFEILVICAGEDFDSETYQKCVKKPRDLDKILRRTAPDYIKLQKFTNIASSLMPDGPSVGFWDVQELRKSWGRISHYLHWRGETSETSDDPQWRLSAIKEVKSIIEPMWQKSRSGHMGALNISTMPSPVREIWEDYRSDKIDDRSAKVRLDIVKTVLI